MAKSARSGKYGAVNNMGSVGSNSFISSLPDWQLRNIDNAWSMGNFGTKRYQEEFMKKQGIDDSTITELNRLLNNHGLGKSAQRLADAKIIEHLESGDSIGKALELQIKMEESLYKRWKQKHSGENEFVYRKGSRKSGVESWTTNEEGADMGQGRIGYDYRSTISAMRKDGFRILGGFGRHLGAPGEEEITFVKYKRK